jgi:hypothetical protein
MAYMHAANDPRVLIADPSEPKRGLGLFRRAFAAIVEARRRAAEREVAAFIERCGANLTDDAERAIDRILTSSQRF